MQRSWVAGGEHKKGRTATRFRLLKKKQTNSIFSIVGTTRQPSLLSSDDRQSLRATAGAAALGRVYVAVAIMELGLVSAAAAAVPSPPRSSSVPGAR